MNKYTATITIKIYRDYDIVANNEEEAVEKVTALAKKDFDRDAVIDVNEINKRI